MAERPYEQESCYVTAILSLGDLEQQAANAVEAGRNGNVLGIKRAVQSWREARTRAIEDLGATPSYFLVMVMEYRNAAIVIQQLGRDVPKDLAAGITAATR